MANDSQALVRHQETTPMIIASPFVPVSLEQAWQLAEWLAGAAILPNHLRQRPNDVFAVVMYGHELGLSPMQACLGVDVIEGTPGLDAQTAMALCKSSPLCKYFRCLHTDNQRATFETWRAGEPTPTPPLTFTIEDAQRAELVRKTSQGHPNNWMKHPAAMLRARAGMALARLVYPDILKGAYSKDEAEEIRDRLETERGPVIEAKIVAPPPPPPPAKKVKGPAAPTADAPPPVKDVGEVRVDRGEVAAAAPAASEKTVDVTSQFSDAPKTVDDVAPRKTAGGPPADAPPEAPDGEDRLIDHIVLKMTQAATMVDLDAVWAELIKGKADGLITEAERDFAKPDYVTAKKRITAARGAAK